MPVKRPAPGDLEPIETASRDEIAGAAAAAPARRRCSTPTTTCRTTARPSTRKGVHPDDLKQLSDLAKFPFTVKKDLRDNYPFGMFAVPREQVARIHASSGTTGKPTVVGYTAARHRHLGQPGGALDPRRRRPARRHRARGLRLRPLHRRPRRALRRRARRLHRDPDVGRPDREAGAADPRLQARHHHGHAQLHAGDHRGVRAPGPRSARELAEGRHLRRRALDRGDAPRDRDARPASTRSTSTACPK